MRIYECVLLDRSEASSSDISEGWMEASLDREAA